MSQYNLALILNVIISNHATNIKTINLIISACHMAIGLGYRAGINNNNIIIELPKYGQIAWPVPINFDTSDIPYVDISYDVFATLDRYKRCKKYYEKHVVMI